jgi:hypothetical protein
MAELQTITAPRAGMHAAPDAGSEMLNELLFGENVQILEEHGPWFKARALHDGYEGYVPRAAAEALVRTSTHRVCVPVTHVYPRPDFKAPPLGPLYFLSALNIRGHVQSAGFTEIDKDRWVFGDHLMPIDHKLNDPLGVALGFGGAPYLWGGRSHDGLDCSGLVQLAVMAAGHPCPRDTKDQVKTLGREISGERPQRGDFVFFERHVGIMIDSEHVLNATARHMRVVTETLKDMEAIYPGGLLAVRRLAPR